MPYWWTGPNFLLEEEKQWPTLNNKDIDELPELKSHSATLCEPLINFEKHYSLNKLQRTFAYVLRFIFNIRNKHDRRVGTLTADELRE